MSINVKNKIYNLMGGTVFLTYFHKKMLNTYKQSSVLSAMRFMTFPSWQISCKQQSFDFPSGKLISVAKKKMHDNKPHNVNRILCMSVHHRSI